MKFVARISSFMLDAAIGLIGMAFVGISTQLFTNDIRATKKEGKRNED